MDEVAGRELQAELPMNARLSSGLLCSQSCTSSATIRVGCRLLFAQCDRQKVIVHPVAESSGHASGRSLLCGRQIRRYAGLAW